MAPTSWRSATGPARERPIPVRRSGRPRRGWVSHAGTPCGLLRRAGALPDHLAPDRPDPVDLSIVIVSWRTRELLVACLQSLRAALGDRMAAGSAEVIVVDNASGDGSAEV